MMQDIKNDDDITTLVHEFYGKVQQNKRLGYVFNDVAQVEWDTHLPKMVDFWSNLLFQTKRYKGRPFRQHMPLPIQKNDFKQWLTLFEQTVDEHFEGERADHAKDMANKIATGFMVRMQSAGKFDEKQNT
jgi:hemoglobin